ncbi:porphobilinogen deaminase [Nitrosopumilus zosterae]|uniref:Probable porphobilinogen deaminase n=1 Tax=Nitrosopumilus zosterae TaxID=718286 RepID=A0A2S2KPM8_9ARCH|nr:hydroxymethylbilane synthase [Nitrosopumilus zosterae]BDQ31408.1 hydroxymethylbilane synthase [Nitrosopumilus zosterae]GBH33616.1 porphobilinogen deaminase [Nitrosopumilus zosterae]
MKYIVGARGSQLSLAQTNWVISELKKVNPGSEYEIKSITTKGDTDSRPLFTINQKGIFEKEVDRAVSQKEVDFAVHSLKDVPSELDESLVIACIPKREAVNDVFISSDGSSLENIKKGAVIGTSSLRRAVQVSRKRPDVTVKPIRGNIETRIKKTSGENFDAIVLAQAGISRLGVDVKFSPLPINDFSPSPGQGAIAIVARSDDTNTISMLKKIEDSDSRLEIEAERALSNYVDSGCRFPLGAYAKSSGTEMTLTVTAFSVDGKQSLHVTKTGSKNDPASLGKNVGEELRKKGVNDLALNWREKVEEWNTT